MIVAVLRGGIPIWLPAWLVEWSIARDERRARAIALTIHRREGSQNGKETIDTGRDTPERSREQTARRLDRRSSEAPRGGAAGNRSEDRGARSRDAIRPGEDLRARAPRVVVCRECSVPFTRHGAAARSSSFYRTEAENDTCIVCREGLDPTTLEPLAARGEPMDKPERLSDADLVEALELAAPRARLAAAEDLRRVADTIARLALEAGRRLREFAGDRALLELRDRCSRLEDAAFHFQTCSTCRREGEGACSSGARFAGYLRGEELEEGSTHAG